MTNQIKIIIWDVDGTLYKSTLNTQTKFKDFKEKVLETYKGKLSFEEIKRLYQDYQDKYKSNTKALALATNLSLLKVTQLVEAYLDKIRPYSKDKLLIKMFNQSSDYFHFALRNGSKNSTLFRLRKLGLEEVKYPYPTELGPFIKIWGTVENFNALKPDPFVFDQVEIWLRKHFLPKVKAEEILMVGDRPEVDLLPAKQQGWQTCLVWQKTKNQPSYVDFIFPSISQLFHFLLRTSK